MQIVHSSLCISYDLLVLNTTFELSFEFTNTESKTRDWNIGFKKNSSRYRFFTMELSPGKVIYMGI